jgi:hypothetical protein
VTDTQTAPKTQTRSVRETKVTFNAKPTVEDIIAALTNHLSEDDTVRDMAVQHAAGGEGIADLLAQLSDKQPTGGWVLQVIHEGPAE